MNQIPAVQGIKFEGLSSTFKDCTYNLTKTTEVTLNCITYTHHHWTGIRCSPIYNILAFLCHFQQYRFMLQQQQQQKLSHMRHSGIVDSRKHIK